MLPSNPSLEFERKAAKALLKQLRAGSVDAIARASALHDDIARAVPETIKLADAQRIIAREYGFASWPRLVRYFGEMEQQLVSRESRGGWRRGIDPADRLEERVKQWMAEHAAKREFPGRAFAAYVPRLYGLKLEEVFESTITEDEARLAIARHAGFSSWTRLLEASAEQASWQINDPWYVDEFREASEAIRRADIRALERIVANNPGMLERESPYGIGVQRLLNTVLTLRDQSSPDNEAALIDWLVARGADLTSELNARLLGMMHMRVDRVRWLIELGADPNWVAPNGLSVLEHAILRWWSGDAVDVLAARAKRRDAAWIAAGLGDVVGLARWFDSNGKLRAEARRDRPNFPAASPGMAMPMIPEPSDEELLFELLIVAAMNGRASTIEYLAKRGANVNSRLWEVPLLVVAVGNGWANSVEALLRCGADPELRGWRPSTSAREMAKEMLEHPDASSRRIAELFGLDPDAVLAEERAKPAPEPQFSSRMQDVLLLAGDDAHRRGEPLVTVEHLFFGLMRARSGAQPTLKHSSRVDIRRFVQEYRERLLPHDDRVNAPAIALDAEVEAALAEAREVARERRRQEITAEYVLYALVRVDERPIARMLLGFGADLDSLRSALAS
jgi:hypothetical protein